MHSDLEGSDRRFQIPAVLAAVALLAGGLWLRFDYEPRLPRRPPRPPPADVNAAFRALDLDANVYRAGVEKDAFEAGLAPPHLEELGALYPYDVVEPRRTLRASGSSLETRDLALSLRTGRVVNPTNKGTFTQNHIILRIENRTPEHVAYRVDTRPPGDPRLCFEKGDLPHNAIALMPRQTVERTECAREGIDTVRIDRVETMRLPPLAFHYVSRLYPSHIGLDPRPARGHHSPKGSICGDIPEQAIRRATEKGEISWRDVIDFYARHSCARYIFPAGYKSFSRASERPLPAVSSVGAARP
jgi:hypothetical protein